MAAELREDHAAPERETLVGDGLSVKERLRVLVPRVSRTPRRAPPQGLYILHTNRCVMSEPFGVPERDQEYKIALRLLNQDPPFDRRILEDLTGRPKRYSELKPLLGDRNDHVLTKALDRLRDEGVLQQGVDLDRDQKVYQLTELGKLALFRMHEMVPHAESIRAYERGKSAQESQA